MNSKLKVNYFKKPFPHILVENIFPDSIFETQVKSFESFNGERWTKRDARYGEKIKDFEFIDFIENVLKPQVIHWCKYLLKMRNNTTIKLYEKVPIGPDLLKWDYGDSIKRCQDGIGYSIDVHSDVWQKVVTIIVYVNGKGSGTTLWGKDMNVSYHIRKPPNSALIFVPMQGQTLHSVEENDVPDRQTIQMTLIKR